MAIGSNKWITQLPCCECESARVRLLSPGWWPNDCHRCSDAVIMSLLGSVIWTASISDHHLNIRATKWYGISQHWNSQHIFINNIYIYTWQLSYQSIEQRTVKGVLEWRLSIRSCFTNSVLPMKRPITVSSEFRHAIILGSWNNPTWQLVQFLRLFWIKLNLDLMGRGQPNLTAIGYFVSCAPH